LGGGGNFSHFDKVWFTQNYPAGRVITAVFVPKNLPLFLPAAFYCITVELLRQTEKIAISPLVKHYPLTQFTVAHLPKR
jgi:hypothetical protein